MNKQETFIVGLLVVFLIGWLLYSNNENKKRLEAWRVAQAELQEAAAATNTLSSAAQASATLGDGASSGVEPAKAAVATAQSAKVAEIEEVVDELLPSDVPEERVTLRANGLDGEEMEIVVSSKGGTLRSASLPAYSDLPGSTNSVRLDFEPLPALALGGLRGLGANADFEIVSRSNEEVALQVTNSDGVILERRIKVLPDYRVEVSERLRNEGAAELQLAPHTISLGAVRRGSSKNDILAVDSLAIGLDERGRPAKVLHWEGRLNGFFTGGSGRGCGGAPAADLLPPSVEQQVATAQEWIALKSRFFVETFSSSVTNSGFRMTLARVPEGGPLRLDYVAAQVRFDGTTLAAGGALERTHTLYIGPKKLSLLSRLGNKTAEIMQFGRFKWMCVLLVPTLNFFYKVIPNYGVAIILLTLLVRLIFWPLTHKSTMGMKRMQELQPKLKELQAQFKDNPQKLQQETWQLYRENKVNPLSSCLPMLIQIPVFIALFTVLRSAVELRYAPFLWISDLSEPENLLKGQLPFLPALNILPFLMAGTMLLQSKLTPSMGDPAQQKMMMWMMPAMMLFMFYSMPSALVLYWTVSQVLAIAQLAWRQRGGGAAATPLQGSSGSGANAPTLTRQARRRLAR